MKLRYYLEQEKLSVMEFADKCSLTRMAIYNMLNKKCPPRKSTVRLIEIATNGLVTLEDLLYARKPKAKKLDRAKAKA